jgi:hypothetical protein
MRRFDMQGLAAAVGQERLARGLTWEQPAAEINIPFQGTGSIPISLSTIRGMSQKRSVTGAVVLQVLRWLGRTPESFLSGRSDIDASLTDPGAVGILRFDTEALYVALNEERERRNMTWKQVAAELPGFTQNMIANLTGWPLIGFPRVMTLTQWLQRPAADFVRVRSR